MDYESMEIFVNRLKEQNLIMCRAIIMSGLLSSEVWQSTPWKDVKADAEMVMRYVRTGQ
jgi:hypothetical protein